jgi:3-dehydroquinate synthase
VAGDERETSAHGGRALLNLGHTFGHAVEAIAGYGTYLHGEAVAIGLVMAARLSTELGRCTADEADAVAHTLAAHQLPTRLHTSLPTERMLEAMRRDKKVRGGKLRFVLQEGIGAASTADDVPEAAAVRALLAGGAVA